MIKSNELVPKVYSEKSFDFHLFTALIDLIFNSVDSDISAIRGLHSPRDCFDENLGRLSRFINLETADRGLLSRYRLMNKSKGTRQTLMSIIEFCGGVIIYENEKPKVEISETSVTITLSKIETKTFNDQLFMTLLRRLLPVYSQVKIILE